jgi:hypothetical protein
MSGTQGLPSEPPRLAGEVLRWYEPAFGEWTAVDDCARVFTWLTDLGRWSESATGGQLTEARRRLTQALLDARKRMASLEQDLSDAGDELEVERERRPSERPRMIEVTMDEDGPLITAVQGPLTLHDFQSIHDHLWSDDQDFFVPGKARGLPLPPGLRRGRARARPRRRLDISARLVHRRRRPDRRPPG